MSLWFVERGMTSVHPQLSTAFVHPTAEVDPAAVVGSGTRVWHLARIRSGARIGRACVIGRNVYVDTGVIVGDRVKIQNDVSVYSGVILEDEVFVGAGVVFPTDPTTVRRGASIGATATLAGGVEVGSFAMITAGAVVTDNVAPFQVVSGDPARPIGWVDRAGAPVSGPPARISTTHH